MGTQENSAIKNEVQALTAIQIEVFKSPGPLTGSVLRSYQERAEKIRALWEVLDTQSQMSNEARRQRREAFRKLRPYEF